MTVSSVRGSFRDPHAFLFTRDDILYRQLNTSYAEHYERVMQSGLYTELVRDGLLISHEEADLSLSPGRGAYRIIRPRKVPFISYAYEWSFSQLKDAARVTLEIQSRALRFGLSLKDASAYNIQFVDGRATLIDTASLEIYTEGAPWNAYRQFCQHFLAPLALMAYRDVRLNQMARVHLDGVPLDLAAELLPFRSHLKLSLLVHVHLHAKSQKRYADTQPGPGSRRAGMSLRAMKGLIENLRTSVERLQWKPRGGLWAGYYQDSTYTAEDLEHKRNVVSRFLSGAQGHTVWDLGANTGMFSSLAAHLGAFTVAWDSDPECVELMYQQARQAKTPNLLPLLVDLTNPSPAIGWDNSERLSFLDRGPVDTVLALALIHHLAIANNVPLPRVAELFSRLCSQLIIEFVPKDDPMVQRLMSVREDIFADYGREGFEVAFQEWFDVKEVVPVGESGRVLYVMARRQE